MLFVKRLTQAGMAVEIAEVLVKEQARLIDNRLATKEDLKHLGLQMTIRLGAIGGNLCRHYYCRHEMAIIDLL